MTLIELLVVITILTTLVAGVIPILSPNNDVRKLREASRALQTFITSAQAEAAKTGRPHGIAFQESAPESGVAIELFHLEVPPPFAGFSDNSRVVVTDISPNYNGQLTRYIGYDLWEITFILAPMPATGSPTADAIPPGTFRIFDEIHVEGNVFLVVDDDVDSVDLPNAPNAVEQVGTPPNATEFLMETRSLQCIWLNNTGQQPPQGLKRYQIIRQPASSSESPLQLPRAIGIDMIASGIEGGDTHSVDPTANPPQLSSSFFNHNPVTKPQDDAGNALPNTVHIMFAPSGNIESVRLNGYEADRVSRVMLLLGRVENGFPGEIDYDFTGLTASDKDEIAERREKVNWINPDSRWIAIAAGTGRAVTVENNLINLADAAYSPTIYTMGSSQEQLMQAVAQQIGDSREFAREMRQVGGN